MNVTDCGPVDLGRGTSKYANLGALTRTLTHNYGILATSFLFIVGVIVVLITLAYMAQKTVADYYTFTMRSSDRDVSTTRTDAKHTDDERYGDKDDERAQYERAKDRNEYGSIQSRIAQIKALYKGYNQEMGSYARNVLDREPDDLIDERILNRGADEYDYRTK